MVLESALSPALEPGSSSQAAGASDSERLKLEDFPSEACSFMKKIGSGICQGHEP